MLFKTFSEYLSKIEKITSRNEMTKILAQLFEKTSADEIDRAVYLLQGRVAPLYAPAEFNLSDKTLVKAISLAFNKPSEQITSLFKKKGDLGEVVVELKRTGGEKNLTISHIYDRLFEITTISGKGTVENKLRIIAALLKEIDAASGKYIIRMMLNKLRLGFSDATILESFSWMLKGTKQLKAEIEKKYNIYPDLGTIGKVLKEKGFAGLHKIDAVPGTPILMARCERAGSPAEILEHGEKFAIEDKYDGFRLQIHLFKSENRKTKDENQLFEDDKKHINHKQVIMYSRNLENVTHMYPDIEKNILEVFKNIDSLIIEGEAVGLNPKTGDILPFQETVQRKRKYDISEKAKDIPLRLIVFEILYQEGKDFINHKFEERRKILEKMFVEKENKHLALSEVVWCVKPDEIEKKFKEATKKNMEGVVAKKADGIYQAGARGWNWIKLKRGFQGQKLTDTIDCTVMGYDVGQGKRAGFGIGDFLIGIFNPKTEKFETVAKIGTGLTDEEWKKIKYDIDKIKVKEKPNNYSVAKGMSCDIWTAPKIVVEIMADEITKSPIHTAGGGLALRFPRLVRFRPDKSAKETTSVAEIEKMYKKQ